MQKYISNNSEQMCTHAVKVGGMDWFDKQSN